MRIQGYPAGLLPALIVLAAATGCGNAKEFPGTYSGDQIHFGQGGGFTGDVTYFVLLDDGRLFQREGSDSSYVFRDHWAKAFTTQTFENYHTLGVDRIDHRHPGNLYYFIEFHPAEGKPHLVSWGQQGHTPPPQITTFYQTLYQSTRKKS